jgi:NADPH:quinone reductase-like Zn-dependent oxidoreductase
MVKDVNAVLDTVGGETLEHAWKTLRRDGILVPYAEIPSEADAKKHYARGVFFIVQSDDLPRFL